MAASDDMLRLIFGFRAAQAVHVAGELGISDHLASGPVEVSALAEQVGADADALRRLLRALAAIGVYEEQPGDVFATNERGRTLEGGSFFEGVPGDGDCHLLKSVLHDWEDDDCVRILRACATSMPRDAVLLIVERLLGGPNEGPDTKFSDLNMMVLPGGRERTEAEFASLAATAGMSVRRVVPTSTAFHAIEAVVS
jgi:O-methyltransferase domain/Dimerisation domain